MAVGAVAAAALGVTGGAVITMEADTIGMVVGGAPDITGRTFLSMRRFSFPGFMTAVGVEAGAVVGEGVTTAVMVSAEATVSVVAAAADMEAATADAIGSHPMI